VLLDPKTPPYTLAHPTRLFRKTNTHCRILLDSRPVSVNKFNISPLQFCFSVAMLHQLSRYAFVLKRERSSCFSLFAGNINWERVGVRENDTKHDIKNRSRQQSSDAAETSLTRLKQSTGCPANSVRATDGTRVAVALLSPHVYSKVTTQTCRI